MKTTSMRTFLSTAKTGDIFLADANKYKFRIKYPPTLTRPARNSKGEDISFTHVGVLVRAKSGELFVLSETSVCRGAPPCRSAYCLCTNLLNVRDVMRDTTRSRFAWRQLNKPVPDEDAVHQWVDRASDPKNSTPKSLSLWMSAFIGQRWLSKLLVGNSKQNDFVCPGTSAMLLHHAGVAVDDKWTYYSLSPHDFASDDTSRFMKPGWHLGPITRIDFS